MQDLVVNQIFKSFDQGSEIALNKVSFSVAKGELFGLIGPDGAGKTTLFRILTTLMLPEHGNASVNNLDIIKDYKTIRTQVGYMPGKFSLYQDLTVEENLDFFASIFNTTVEENYHLIKDIYIQLEPFKHRRAGALSGGMKQKLALCCALIHKPKILFLDEPTTGVDAVSRRDFWDMLKKLKDEGITILVSTPYMDEAILCERIALIQEGSILSIDSPQNIIKEFPQKLYAIKSEHMSSLLRDLQNNDLIASAFSFGEYHHITFKDNYSDNPLDLKFIDTSKYLNLKISAIEPTIEDCFIKLMDGM